MDNSIDVIIPVFNGEKFIETALVSVLDQTYPPQKIIVIDDGSTDHTAEIVSRYLHEAITVDYLKQVHSGRSAARNRGIKNSTAKYVAFLDADDFWKQDKLEKQLLVFRKSQEMNLGLVYCDIIPIDTVGHVLYHTASPRLETEVRGNVFEQLVVANRIAGSNSGVLVLRECFDRVGGFDEALETAEDWDLWLKIAEHYQVDYASEQLVYIRHHSENSSRNHYEMILGRIKVLIKFSREYSYKKQFMNELRYHVCRMRVYCFFQQRSYQEVDKLLDSELKKRLFKNKADFMSLFSKIADKIILKIITRITCLIRGRRVR